MKKTSILGLLLALSSLAMAEETVLVPLENGNYKRVPISEIIDERVERKVNEIKKEIIEEETFKKENKVVVSDFEFDDPLTIEDLLKVSVNFDNKEIDKDSLEKNKNWIQNKMATDFINNSRMTKRVTEDMYLLNLDIFGANTKFESIDEKLKNIGFIAGIQYGINDEINVKLNAGYSNAKFNSENEDNLYLSLDYNYKPYGNDWNWEIGSILGYMNGEHKDYKVKDMFIGTLYTNVEIPVTETISLLGNYETTIMSNKLEAAIKKDIYYFDDYDVNFKVGSGYVFYDKDRDKKIYTHLDEDQPEIKVAAQIKTEKMALETYYEFQQSNLGFKIEYAF